MCVCIFSILQIGLMGGNWLDVQWLWPFCQETQWEVTDLMSSDCVLSVEKLHVIIKLT